MPAFILIVDDEAQLRKLLSRLISLEGFRVTEADTIRLANEQLGRLPFDVVLCDVKLPDGNGVEFVKEIKNRFPSIEVILLTAFGNIADGVQAMKNGAFDYVVKGDDNDRILPLLHQAGLYRIVQHISDHSLPFLMIPYRTIIAFVLPEMSFALQNFVRFVRSKALERM